MIQMIITGIIVGVSLAFVARWTYKKITSHTPDCCSTDKQIPACSQCGESNHCAVYKENEKG
ncbi:MAG: hypothetical protein DRG63_01535 [Deltaproteobacteria bacterium]|nr:MAG: hypothetical protein DRG63_01535 [Deltaproteobacteria bacterium]